MDLSNGKRATEEIFQKETIAEEIVEQAEREYALQTTGQTSLDTGQAKTSMAESLMKSLFDRISDVDMQAAARHVQTLREAHSQATEDELVEMLIKIKCQQTAAIGAATSAVALIPGVGTFLSLTAGVAVDIAATFTRQAELILEIAEVHQYELSEEEKQRTVMMVTGLGAGANQLAYRAGDKIGRKLSERYASKWLARVLPVIGMASSASTNVLSTYIMGRRAHAYFGLGPEAMDDWKESARALTGVDERKIAGWLAETGQTAGSVVASGARKAAGKTKAGTVAAVGAGKSMAAKAGGGVAGLVARGFGRLKAILSALLKPLAALRRQKAQ